MTERAVTILFFFVSGEEQAVVAIRQVGDFPAHVASWDNGHDQD